MIQTTKHNIIVIAIAVVIAGAIPFIYQAGKNEKIDYKTFHTKDGWGYDIVVKGKTFIHQQYIPAISEEKEFETETQAKEMARLVVYKLKNNKLPTLSKTEVERICDDH